MRSGVNQATGAATQAGDTSSELGAEAQGIGSTLTPFLTSELTHPQGFGQNDTSAMLAAAEGGAGGATSALVGKANQETAQTHNAGGMAAVLDSAARSRAKAAAGTSESIAGENAQVKQQQQQSAAKGLQGMYGTDTSGMLDASGQIAGDVKAAADANQTGWLQNTNQTMLDLSEEYKNAGEGTSAFAMCPVAGSMYLMSDGSEKPVEQLKVGELIAGIDEEPQEIDAIESGLAPAVEVMTDDGYIARNSATHAYALPRGGFVVAVKALGRTILTAKGPAKVVSVEDAGEQMVFNVMTGGSHTYRADGVWSLGVGDAERRVSMPEWRKIGMKLKAAA